MHKIYDKWITASLLLFLMGIYMGISSFSVHGLLGFIFLNFIIFAIAERNLYKLRLIKNENRKGMILFAVSTGYLLLALFNKNYSGKLIVLSVSGGILLLILLWIIFENVKKFADRIVLLFVVFGLLLASLYIWQNAGAFSPDSYSYYEIAETIGNDYGKVGTIRQYIVKTDYNISFPYFYPCCIFIVNALTGLGRYSGVLFNVYVMLLTVLMLVYISRKFVNKLWCGGLASFFLLTSKSYLDEVCAARSIPLAVLLSAIAFYVLARIYFFKDNNKILPFIVGLAVGLLMSTRFDGIAMAAYCVLLVFLCNKKRVWNITSYMIGLILTASPWIVYSIRHFGRLWISDNSGTAFLVTATVPTRIIMPGDDTLTVFNASKEWIHALIGKAFTVVLSMLKCSFMADVCIFLCILLIAYAIAEKKMKKNGLIALIVTVIFYSGKTCMYILVGYGDTRYHVETVVIVSLVFMMLVEYLGASFGRKYILVALSGIELVSTIFVFRYVGYAVFANASSDVLRNIEVAPEWVTELNNELYENIEDDGSEILFLGGGYTFGGWTDWKIYASPASNKWEKIEYAMKQYMDVEYVVVPKEYSGQDVIEQLTQRYEKKELTDYYLFEVGDVR